MPRSECLNDHIPQPTETKCSDSLLGCEIAPPSKLSAARQVSDDMIDASEVVITSTANAAVECLTQVMRGEPQCGR
jgi:hypothetical protein